jgi:hypothetical protein
VNLNGKNIDITKSKNRINLLNCYLALVFVFFFMSSLSRTLLPSSVNILGVVSVLILNIFIDLKNKGNLLVIIFIYLMAMPIVLSSMLFEQDVYNLEVWSYIIMISLVPNLKNNLYKYKPWIAVFLYANLLALIWEKYTGSFIFPNYDLGYETIIISVYAQGLNTYTKGTAEFLVMSLLLFRKDYKIIFVTLVSLFLTGVRSGIVVGVIIVIIDYIVFSTGRRKLTGFIALATLGVCIPTLIYYDYIYASRFTSVFQLDSSTYTDRIWIVKQHLELYLTLPIFQQLFGSGIYCSNYFQWGSESLPVQILTYYGVIPFLIYSFVCLHFTFNLIIHPSKIELYYPLILIIISGFFVRFPVGWYGGIIFYSLLYESYYIKKINKKLKTYVKKKIN